MRRRASSNCASSRSATRPLAPRYWRCGSSLLHDDVGLDAAAVDRAARRRQIARRRELDGAAFAERHDRLHGAFAVGRLADDARSAVILQRAGDDLGSRGRGRVHEHDRRHALRARRRHRPICSNCAWRMRPVPLTMTPSARNASATAHGRVEQAAGVAAQIEHQAEQLVSAGRGREIARRLLEIRRRAFRERRQAHVRESVAEVLALARS